MIKYSLDEFTQIIIEELENYEVSEQNILSWKSSFNKMVKDNAISKKNLIVENNKKYFSVPDEMEIFSIVDDYVLALEDNALNEYWNSFK